MSSLKSMCILTRADGSRSHDTMSVMARKYTRDAIHKFLSEHFVMEIATANDNKPSVSVVMYDVDDEFAFYFATHSDSYKAQNLKANPLISLAVWEHGKMLVQADGAVAEVTNQKQSEEIMDRLAEKASIDDDFWPPIFRVPGGAYVIFKIKPSWLRALDLESKNIHEKEPPFTELKFS